ncbi:MAG TPA: hypothetical protein VHP63_00175 [candidate division Zixibacteria bacterium]|nr:hypothetical protein [candidate division Zixibacteria bacterium]
MPQVAGAKISTNVDEKVYNLFLKFTYPVAGLDIKVWSNSR